MDSLTYLGLQSTHNPHRWYLPLGPRVITPGNFLYGGAGLASSILAIERTTGRQCIWAAAQYLDYARPPDVLDIDVYVPISGHQTSQARSIGHVGEKEVITVNASLGDRNFDVEAVFEKMPDVPRPEDCEERKHPFTRLNDNFHSYVEERVVNGRAFEALDGKQSDGRLQMWIRIPSRIDNIDAATLAYLADFIPMASGQALGIRASGNSLDNTIRIYRPVPTEWVLLDIQVHAVIRGFASGTIQMFAEDGTLMATASQSCTVKHWKLNPEMAAKLTPEERNALGIK